MPDLKQLDHLLAILGRARWSDTGLKVPLRWIEAAPEARAQMLTGPHDDWAEVSQTTIWGRPQSYFWFAGMWQRPDALQGRDLWLRIDAQFGKVMGRCDPQCLVRINDQIVQGGDINHRYIPLDGAGDEIKVMVEAGTIEDRHQIGFGLQVVERDALAEALYFDLLTPLDVARHLPENDHRRDLILNTVHAALCVMDLRPGDPERRANSLQAARDMAQRIYTTADTEAMPVVTVTGHTHIDVAWLWRVRETRQKMARSVATALSLMRDYPDYSFMYNQGYLLDLLQQDYPDLFDQLKTRQQAGQVEIEGALWLEPDANMTGGESLVRHMVRGIRYHQETFGVTPKIVWLPDTFGYSSALPQLMQQAGQEVFVTHKMSWNDTNKMPNEVFWWEGLDGSRVPTYFLTAQPMESTSIGTTYCADLRPSHVMGSWRRFSQKQTDDKIWLCYGFGDGGGGPTREMLEQIRRMEQGIPGCPKVEHGPMGPFFDDLVARMQATPEAYPDWVGELYLEFHRGTFTSVAEVKRNNRRAEAMMRALEALAVLAMIRAGVSYPQDRLEALWDVVLLNQFHDILPGSSIGEVYEDSRAEFDRFFAQADALGQELAGALGGDLVCNPFGQTRAGHVLVPGETVLAGAQQAIGADGSVSQMVPVAPVPAGGARALDLVPGQGARGDGGLIVTVTRLENPYLVAGFDGQGRLVSLVDKRTGLEKLAEPGNRLRAYRDLPVEYDAWDIDATYPDQMWEIDDLQSAEVVEEGPYRAAIRFVWRYESSTITQVVSLGAGDRHLDIDCHVDWAEQNTLVKADFPLALRAREVMAETQFGHVARATHRNTSWDQARFEQPMHRWVAMQAGGSGVAFLNDCKYGYSAEGAQVALTLLRAPTWPWDGADLGTHRMRYGIALFDDLAEVPPLAEAFNHPMQVWRGAGAGAGAMPGLVEVMGDQIAVEAIKRSEDGQAVILRLWERLGQGGPVQLRFAPEVTGIAECDLLETAGAPEVPDPDGVFMMDMRAFEIKTLRVTLNAHAPEER